MTNTYSDAFKLLTLGYSIIPSGGGDSGKAPLINWKPYQTVPADEEQLEAWENDLHPLLWGVLTNENIGVIDADTKEEAEKLLTELGPPHVVTPRGGVHYYIDTTGGHAFKTKAGVLPGIDVRGVGGVINIAGSSKHGTYQIKRVPIPDELIHWDNLPERLKLALNGSKQRSEPKKPGEAIPESKRNDTLTGIAGEMRRRGVNQPVIEIVLLEINSSQCNPPLPDNEVRAIAQSISRYEPSFNLTDYGNGERLASTFGKDIRFSPERNLFLIYNGKKWEADIGKVRVTKKGKKVARNIYREAAEEEDDERRKDLVKHAVATERQARLDSMIKSVESEPDIAIDIECFDTNPWLLNVNNGTIDLRTGNIKSHDRDDLITELLPIDYNPSASSEEWVSFLNRIFNNDPDLIAYTRRSLGYSISGVQSEQVFFFCHGGGFNGKSTLLNSCRLVMGGRPPPCWMKSLANFVIINDEVEKGSILPGLILWEQVIWYFIVFPFLLQTEPLVKIVFVYIRRLVFCPRCQPHFLYQA